MIDKTIKVLVVDDTVVYRRILSAVVSDIANAELVAAVPNGKLALNRVERDPIDLVLLDVEMPVMDGLETLRELRRGYPEIGVIMVSGVNKHSAEVTIEALDEGALDFVPKPEGADPEESRRLLATQLGRVIQLFSTQRALRGVREGRPPVRAERKAAVEEAKAPAARVRRSEKPKHLDIIAIGVSTGGPNALTQVVPQLPADLNLPVLIVQHMPALFTASLAESLNKKSKLKVSEAKDGQTIRPNEVLIAPGGKHMLVRKKAGGSAANPEFVIGLSDAPPENNCRPAVDVLFRSVATHYGKGALALIMTGMGEDGCKGVRALKRQGCYCLTQNEASCVVYGMPRAVEEAGLSDESISLDALASRIIRIAKKAA